MYREGIAAVAALIMAEGPGGRYSLLIRQNAEIGDRTVSS